VISKHVQNGVPSLYNRLVSLFPQLYPPRPNEPSGEVPATDKTINHAYIQSGGRLDRRFHALDAIPQFLL
jgi:hypothetical protein